MDVTPPVPPQPPGSARASGPRANQQRPAGAYAGFITRMIGIAIDAVVIDAAALAVAGAVLLVGSVFPTSGKHHALTVAIGSVAFVIWVIAYFGFFWTTTGQTIGSRVMQIRLTRTGGDRLRPRHALARLVGMVVSLPLFWGYLPILWTPRRRAAFDLLAGTVVTEVVEESGFGSPGLARGSPLASSARERDGASD